MNLNSSKISRISKNRTWKKTGPIEKNVYKFCFIVDFPMYEYNEEEEK